MKFDHVKFAARDPVALASFYEDTLECRVVFPLTELDELASRGIGVPGSVVAMTVLALPGYDDSRPNLEIYAVYGTPSAAWAHEPGQGQIAFQVGDVDETVARVLGAGGSLLGEVVNWVTPTGAMARFVYTRDPEGNIVDVYGTA